MELVRNSAGHLFTSAEGGARRTYSLVEFIRHWAYPAGVLGLWLVAVVFTASELVSVGPALRAIPEAHRLSQPARPPGNSARR